MAYRQNISHRYPVKALYAYEQSVSPGANDVRRERSRSIRHFIYTELWEGKKIEIVHVWLRGQQVAFEVMDAATPVTLQSSIRFSRQMRQEDTLVKAKGREVLQIVPQLPVDGKTISIPRHLRYYDLLMAYRFNGNLYFLGAKKFRQLEPAVNQ